MTDWHSEEDPQLSALVARVDAPPMDRLDVEALRRAVRVRAMPLMEQRRRAGGWRRWAPVSAGLSLAIAAGLAALLVGRPEDPSRALMAAQPEALVTADLSEAEFQAIVSGAADSHSLLMLAAGE